MNRAYWLCILIVVMLHGAGFWRWANPYGLTPISDEPVYTTLAKSLATKGEYKDLSLPGEPYHTKYPILYPLVLSWVWRQTPSFPQNVWLLRLMSGLCGTGFLLILGHFLWRIWKEDSLLPALVVILCGLHPATLASSTAISSEAAYLLLSLLALWVALKLEDRREGFVWPILCGLLLALSSYVRVSALALIGAVVLDLLLKKRWKGAAIGSATVTLGSLPWWVWSRLHNEAARLPEFIFNTDYLSDLLQITRVQGVTSVVTQNLLMIAIGIPKLMIFPYQTNLQQITQLTAWLGLPLLVLMVFGFFRTLKIPRFRVLHFYLSFYLLLLAIWPYPAGERFLLPMLPWFYFFLAVELREIFLRVCAPAAWSQATGLITRRSIGWLVPSALTTACLASLIIHSFLFAGNLDRQLQSYQTNNQEMEESFQWIRDHSAPTDSLMAYPNPLYYLHTGRKTAPMTFDPSQKKTEPRFLEGPIRKHHIKYLVMGKLDFAVFTPDVIEAMKDELKGVLKGRNGFHFRKVFSSSSGNYRIYEIVDKVQANDYCDEGTS